MSPHVTDIEGDWKIVNYSKHPECIDCQVEIKGIGLDPDVFKLNMHMVNYLNCMLQHNPSINQWKVSDLFSTELSGSPEEMAKEHVFRKLISGIQKLEVHDEQELIIETNDGEQVRLERLP